MYIISYYNYMRRGEVETTNKNKQILSKLIDKQPTKVSARRYAARNGNVAHVRKYLNWVYMSQRHIVGINSPFTNGYENV